MAVETVNVAVFALICATIMLAGCCGIIPPSPAPANCSSPYIDDGNGGCCMDSNSDGACDQETKNYTCQDGTVVQDMSKCPKLFRCSDNSLVANADDCPKQRLNESGIYTCNDNNNPPCDSFMKVYCDKFTPIDLDVRKAASEAISGHPGPVSINQLLDIYDWVRKNVFYQNVPADLGRPYYPSETLATRSGDCKNQAVLMASMVEAIGGSASVRIVPDCNHAFAYAYVGNESGLDMMVKAIRSRYPDAKNATLSYRYDNNSGKMEYWMIFDTAGAWYPGNTIDKCLNASQRFDIYDCNTSGYKRDVETSRTDFGPWETISKTDVISSNGGYHYYWWEPTMDEAYAWCKFNITVTSLSGPLNWYLMSTPSDFEKFKNGKSFYSTCRGTQTQGGACSIYRNDSQRIYLVVQNKGDNDISASSKVVTECFGK